MLINEARTNPIGRPWSYESGLTTAGSVNHIKCVTSCVFGTLQKYGSVIPDCAIFWRVRSSVAQ